jgi:hypothetical protein
VADATATSSSDIPAFTGAGNGMIPAAAMAGAVAMGVAAVVV